MSNRIDDYINMQPSRQKEICRYLRKLVLETFPGVKEELKWGVPAFAGGDYYIVSLKDHVNLGFKLKGLTEEEEKLFEGGGKKMKHVKVFSLDGLGEERIIGLLKLVREKAGK
jgi:hypothetical protein